MNELKSVEKAMKEIRTHFDGVQVRYEFHTASKTHFIDLRPLEVYNSEKFAELISPLVDQFDKLSQLASELCFVSEDSLTKLSEKAMSYEEVVKEAFEIDTVQFLKAPVLVSEEDFGYYVVSAHASFVPGSGHLYQYTNEDLTDTRFGSADAFVSPSELDFAYLSATFRGSYVVSTVRLPIKKKALILEFSSMRAPKLEAA